MPTVPTPSRAVRVAAVAGVPVVGAAVTRPWAYDERASGELQAVAGVETVAGAAGLGLALLAAGTVLRSWSLPSALAASVLGALIGLFGLIGAVTYPPEATTGPLVLLAGGALPLAGGSIGIVERLLAGDRALPSSRVAIGGGFLIAVAPLFGYADCRGSTRPCFEYVTADAELLATTGFPLVLVLVLTRSWRYWAKATAVVLGLVAFGVGVLATGLVHLHGVSGAPLASPRLPVRVYTYVGAVGGFTILLGGIYGIVRDLEAGSGP